MKGKEQKPAVVLHNASESAEIVASIDDILTEILLILPIKPLMRFKLVSKHWFSLITNHGFCLRRNPTPKPASGLFLSIKDHLSYRYEYIPLYPSFVPSINIGFTTAPSKTEIIHSCNGLLLCCSSKSCEIIHSSDPVLFRSDCSIYVYNPTTNFSATLPIAPRLRHGATLVFDPMKSPHYKVVLVVFIYSVKGRTCQIHIYSSKTGGWSSGGEIREDRCADIYGSGVYWNSSIHWLNYELSTQKPTNSIRFHVDTHMFEEMPSPPVLRDENYRSSNYFGESCDHLHFIEPILPRFNIYEMKRDYSEWFVKYQVDLTQFCAGHPEVIRTNFLQQDCYVIYVLSLIRGENDKVSKLLLRIPGKAVKFNLVDGTSEKLCDFVHDKIAFLPGDGDDDDDDGVLETYKFIDKYGLDYIQFPL